MNHRAAKIGIASAVALIAVAAGMFSAGAFGASAKELGRMNQSLQPDCGGKPDSRCVAIGSTTGFSTKLGRTKQPFIAPANGRIVAWGIELGHRPSDRLPPDADEDAKSNLEFFQDLFGNDRYGKNPVAQIAILKRLRGVRFRLKSKSPAVNLGSSFYNRDSVITLEDPLAIRKGEVVALSSLTWLPNIKEAARSGRTEWRAFGPKRECQRSGTLETSAHKKLGTTRGYKCTFDDRLFYSAYFVKKRN